MSAWKSIHVRGNTARNRQSRHRINGGGNKKSEADGEAHGGEAKGVLGETWKLEGERAIWFYAGWPIFSCGCDESDLMLILLKADTRVVKELRDGKAWRMVTWG
jgi:hypothetical protein